MSNGGVKLGSIELAAEGSDQFGDCCCCMIVLAVCDAMCMEREAVSLAWYPHDQQVSIELVARGEGADVAGCTT